MAVVALVAALFALTGWALSRCSTDDFIVRVPTTTTSAPG